MVGFWIGIVIMSPISGNRGSKMTRQSNNPEI